MSETRSAEWLKGAIGTCERLIEECQTVIESDLPHVTKFGIEDVLDEYSQLLAAAEAREARTLPEVLEVARKALDPFARAYRVSMEPFGLQIDQADGAQHWLPGGWPTVADCKKANDALDTLATYRDGTAEALRLLEEMREECDNHADVEDAGSTEDEPQRVRPNLALRMQTLADRAIAALRGGKP